MNTFELQHRFNQEMEKLGFSDPIMSTTVEDYINYQYQQYITEKYDSLINPAEKFEITERISRILSPLLMDFTETVNFIPITTNSSYGYLVTLPSDLQYIIKEKLVIRYTDCNNTTQQKDCKVIPIKHNRITSNKDNPFVKPADDEIWRLNFSNNRVELILYNGATPYSYSCRYLKKHNAVSFSSNTTMEIDSSVHEEIVVRAVYALVSDLRNKQTKEKENVQ